MGSLNPTAPTCTTQIASAATIFAATPAHVTIMRSFTGRFVNRLGSSFSYGQSSSSSGNATYPPVGERGISCQNGERSESSRSFTPPSLSNDTETQMTTSDNER